MNITVINNESRYLNQLLKWAHDGKRNQVDVIDYDKIDKEQLHEADLIILSGGYKDPVMYNPEKYKQEIELIKSTTKAVLGICMGFEIIAYAFGSDLERMPNKESKKLKLEMLEASPIFEGLKTILVSEHHRWRIKKLGNDLSAIAKSIDGIEIIQHIKLPIYGCQFHPELEPNSGSILFHNLYRQS